MNKRIKELMLEAGYAAPELALRAQKLAELIVQECIRIDIVHWDAPPADKIREHFGLDE